MTLGHLKTRRGFTLIELLVVIAIIAILSAVILVSLTSARQKGVDGSITTDADTIRTEAEIYYDNNSNYGTALAQTSMSAVLVTGTANMFVADPTILNAMNQAYTSENKAASTVFYSVGVNGASYAAVVKLTAASAATPYFCVDSSGNQKSYASGSAPATGGGTAASACP